MSDRIIVRPEQRGQRLDVLLSTALPQYSRAQIKKAVKHDQCRVNDKVVSSPACKVDAGAEIVITIQDAQTQLTPSNEALTVLWHDHQLAAIVKPANLTVHPCPSCAEETLVHRLLSTFPQLAAQGGDRPGIVHRLDKNTTGIMLIGLTEQSRLDLAKAFAERLVQKKYLALVSGNPPSQGKCEAPVGRHPKIKTRMAVVPKSHGGREAFSQWQKLWQGKECALLAVAISTGRTHQIRVHLAHLGWPILGDSLYAPAAVAALAPRQMLHAWQITVNYPNTEEKLHFCTPPPTDFLQCAMERGGKMLPVVVTGNEGCGKSLFCATLTKLGVPVVSADDIVGQLYSGKGDATEWIRDHMGEIVLNPDNSVNKQELFTALKTKPWLRPELEKVVHGLVLAKIEKFWQEQDGKPLACAEIPLYFESSLPGIMKPKPFVVGISCPTDIRIARIAANRGWSAEKIATMESWQMPEAEKMARCDLVIMNNDTVDALEQAATRFVQEKIAGEHEKLLQKITSLCACPDSTQSQYGS